MTTLAAALAETATELAAAGFDEPRRRARRVVAAALALPPATVLGYPERGLSAADRRRLRVVLDRLLAREPLSRILGRREFWGLDFALSRDTLDPRPESETLVEAVLRRLPDRRAPLRFLDLGTGSGCLLLALLAECPAATGIGVDIAAGAARTARDNAAALGFADRAHFLIGDWGAAIAGRFDAILANPPYIRSTELRDLPPEVARFDPRRALDGGADGLQAYRAIAGDLGRLMASGGMFVCEIGSGQAASVAAILRAGGLLVEASEPDLAGIERCLIVRHRTAND